MSRIAAYGNGQQDDFLDGTDARGHPGYLRL